MLSIIFNKKNKIKKWEQYVHQKIKIMKIM